MTLIELIEMLEKEDPNKVCRHAFGSPHSWRGSYDELAFEPAQNRTVREMLAAARSAVGATYGGYKGGEFTMNEHTNIHIDHYGHGGDLLPEYGVRWMLDMEHDRDDTSVAETALTTLAREAQEAGDYFG